MYRVVGLEFGADDHVTKPFDLRERLARIRIMSRRTTEQGHGARLCALRDRRSGATTMGSTALDGLMLGRRSGAVDRGVLPCPMQQKHMAASTVEDMLCDRSGLLGVSGISDDLRLLEASGDPRAGQAWICSHAVPRRDRGDGGGHRRAGRIGLQRRHRRTVATEAASQ